HRWTRGHNSIAEAATIAARRTADKPTTTARRAHWPSASSANRRPRIIPTQKIVMNAPTYRGSTYTTEYIAAAAAAGASKIQSGLNATRHRAELSHANASSNAAIAGCGLKNSWLYGFNVNNSYQST